MLDDPAVTPLTSRALGREAHVWLAPQASILASADVAAHRGLLSEEERGRMERFRFLRDRESFLAARILLRTALSALVPEVPIAAWGFRRGRNERPEVCAPRGTAPRFSLSHTPGLVACVVTTTADCGIDVEASARELDVGALAPGVLSPSELAALDRTAAAERTRAFLRHWTLKEAFAKALGLGLDLSFGRYGFDLADGIRLVAPPESHEDPRAWQFAQWSAGAHEVAVALRRGGGAELAIVQRSGGDA